MMKNSLKQQTLYIPLILFLSIRRQKIYKDELRKWKKNRPDRGLSVM